MQSTAKLYLTLILVALTSGLKSQPLSIYKDVKQPIERRVDDLLSKMTLEEKVLQLNQYTLGRNDNKNNVEETLKKIPAGLGSVIYFNSDPTLRNQVQRKMMNESRLGIPMIFGYDVIHGYRTTYPISLAQACSWNTHLVQQACAVAAQEARMSGVDWTFSPMVDVARDGRWGRVAEGYGEDPYTNGAFAVASIRGYQGDDLTSPTNVAACLKHYVGYGASEGGRDYVFTEISRQTLWDTYLLPFQMGVEAGAATLMSSFNDISGTPGTANSYILRDILKERWLHDGFVVSDWGAIEQLRSQGVAADRKEAALKAFSAGVEMDMMNGCYDSHLASLVAEGKVPMSLVDDAVRRVLRVKFRLGLFENPYTADSSEKDRFLLPESMDVARQLAEESIVLLKNERKVLPLLGTPKLAVIGPLAKQQLHLLGSWAAHGKAEDVVSIYHGLEQYYGAESLSYAKGCDFEGNATDAFNEARAVASKADVILLCLGEKRTWSGENASRSTLSLPLIQERLVEELSILNKPIVLLLSSGRPLELDRLEPLADAMLAIWQPGVTTGTAVARILSGVVNPSGKLSMTFPYATGQIPIYYNQRKSARTHQGKYQDIPTKPLYEFAYGLSYTDYSYGDLQASATHVKRSDSLTLQIPVTNVGGCDGKETVHWFVYDPVSSISRPLRELKHFDKQLIKAGETHTFTFNVDLERDFGYIDASGKRFLESGDYYIIVKDKRITIHLID